MSTTKISKKTWVIGLAVLSLACPACARAETATDNGPDAARVEEIVGRTDAKKVVLTGDANERLGIQTTPVRAQGAGLVVPYAALLYDPNGGTFVYTGVGDLGYVREAIDVARIDGDTVLLTAGPPVGTEVVTVGAAELLGTEYGVGED